MLLFILWANIYDWIPHMKRCLLASQVSANRAIQIHTYTLANKKGLSSVTMKHICSLQQPISLSQILQLNTVWHLSWELGKTVRCRPNWGGFMQSACTGLHAPPAAIAMLPLIDMKPSDETCIYSTLLFVDLQSQEAEHAGSLYNLWPAFMVKGDRNFESCCT